MCLRVLKESIKIRFDSYSHQEQSIDHIPYYLSELSRAHFVRQPFSKQLYTIPIKAFSYLLNIKHKEFVEVPALKLLLAVFVFKNSTVLIIDITLKFKAFILDMLHNVKIQRFPLAKYLNFNICYAEY